QLIPRTDAPWVALLLLGVTTALATFLSMKIKIMLLAGGLTFYTMFYVWGCLAGRSSGRTRNAAYKAPLHPLFPIVGVVICVGEVAALWLDPETGRPSLFIWVALLVASFLYY